MAKVADAALLFLLLAAFLLTFPGVRCHGLALDYYKWSCPNAEAIIRQTLRQRRFRDPTAPAALLRLSFHDCQVTGCDASILLHSQPGMRAEMESDNNFNIRHLVTIDKIKSSLENACPNTVSCADIVVMAARDSIAMSGGPMIPILTGRRDSKSASLAEANARLPPATITVEATLNLFAEQGLNAEESVAILGSHSIGISHCKNFLNRLKPKLDPSLPRVLSVALTKFCDHPNLAEILKIFPNDLTNFIFDNLYFKSLLLGGGILTIDSSLANNVLTRRYVEQFANDQNLFFERFSSAFIKLTNYNVLTGQNGEIRKHCGYVN